MLRKKTSVTVIVFLLVGLIISCSRVLPIERTATADIDLTPGIAISNTPERTSPTKTFSIDQFQAPSTLTMETSSFAKKGTWAIYTPAHWQERYGQKSDFPDIVSIVIDSDGAVWFATMGGARFVGDGVYRFDGRNWTDFSTENGLPSDEISAMAVTPDGAIWFGTLSSGIARFDGETWAYYKASNGLISNDVRAMAVAPNGNLWVGTGEHGVSVFDGIKWTTFKSQGNAPKEFVGTISILPDGEILLSSSSNGIAKLIQYDGTNWEDYPMPWEGKGEYVMDMALSPNHEMWFATEFDGLYRLRKEEWIKYTSETGLISNQLLCVDITPDGSVWLGTAQGIAHFDGESWDAYLNEDDADNRIAAITSSPDGTVWFGSNKGFVQYLP
jgi:ligand-binding sensor domain-containing protein